MNTIPTLDEIAEVIETEPMRVLVERYPAVMPLLSQYGFDLCCGGGHTVAEAARLHGIEVEPLLAQVAEVMRGGRG